MQERRHLASGNDIVWTEAVVNRWVAALGAPGGAEFVDVVLEDRVVIIDEQVAASVIDVTDCPYQECGHLLSGDLAVGAEPIVGWRVAAPGDPSGSQLHDVGFENRVVIIDEWVIELIGEIQGSDQERRHLAPRHLSIRAEAVVGRRITASGDPLVGHPLDVEFKDVTVVVGEPAATPCSC